MTNRFPGVASNGGLLKFKMAWELELNEAQLEELYVWIDNVPLSKPKTRIERDFSDGNEKVFAYLTK